MQNKYASFQLDPSEQRHRSSLRAHLLLKLFVDTLCHNTEYMLCADQACKLFVSNKSAPTTALLLDIQQPTIMMSLIVDGPSSFPCAKLVAYMDIGMCLCCCAFLRLSGVQCITSQCRVEYTDLISNRKLRSLSTSLFPVLARYSYGHTTARKALQVMQ